MLAFTDLAGWAAIISAVFAGVASVIGTWNQRTVRAINRKVDTNGDPRELGQLASDVAKVVAPPTPEPPAEP